MGRKKQTEELPLQTQPAQQTTSNDDDDTSNGDGKVMKKAEAVRRAIAAGKEKNADIIRYVKETFNIDIAVSNIVNVKQSKKKSANNGEPSLEMLLTLKSALDESKSDLADVIDQIDYVIDLAEKMGGIDNLKRCIKVYQQLMPTKGD